GVVARAWALLTPEAPRRSEIDRFAAGRLIFDSHEAFAVTGIRAPSASRHLVWRAPGADIDLRLEETGLGSAAGLTGQILPRSRARHPGSGDVWLAERGRPPVWSPLGPNGEFTLPAPRSDRWALWLKWGS